MSYKPEFANVSTDQNKTWDNTTCLILDGDEISYQVAAACEQRGIVVTNKTNESQATFKTRTQLKDFLNGLEVPEGFYDVVDSQIAEPAKNAFATVKAKILNLKEKFSTNNVEIYMSGEGNYRLDLPLPERYKSNRSDTIRPLLLQEIRDYLVQHQGAIIVHGDEADAMLASRMYDGYKTGQNIIAVSIDKDLRITSGTCYNPDKDELLKVDGFGKLYKDEKGKVRGYGRMFLYHQLLCGDNADGFDPRSIVKAITGATPKFGETASFKLLSDCSTDKDAWKVIHDQYVKWFGVDKFEYTTWNGSIYIGNYLDALQMIFDCAYMRRFENDIVNVQSVLKKYGIIE